MHNPFEPEEDVPLQFHWRWEEKLVFALVLLWIVAAFVGAYFFV